MAKPILMVLIEFRSRVSLPPQLGRRIRGAPTAPLQSQALENVPLLSPPPCLSVPLLRGAHLLLFHDHPAWSQYADVREFVSYIPTHRHSGRLRHGRSPCHPIYSDPRFSLRSSAQGLRPPAH